MKVWEIRSNHLSVILLLLFASSSNRDDWWFSDEVQTLAPRRPKYQPKGRKTYKFSHKCHFPRAKIEPSEVTWAVRPFSISFHANRGSNEVIRRLSINRAEKQLKLIKLAEICAAPCMCVLPARAVKDLFWLVFMASVETLGLSRHPARAAFIPDVAMVKLMGAIPATRQWFESWRRLLRKSDWYITREGEKARGRTEESLLLLRCSPEVWCWFKPRLNVIIAPTLASPSHSLYYIDFHLKLIERSKHSY